jgi:capsular polysaccharide biosynthesis protein
LFSEAKYIVGPLSSGFANAIFSQKGTKILVFSNCTRHDDMYLTKLAVFKSFDLRIIIGRQSYPDDANSEYTINMDELNSYIVDSDFIID